jgi:hypothetical protein
LIGTLALVCAQCAVVSSEDDVAPDVAEMMSVFVAAVRQWRDAVEFRCTFTYRQAWVVSREDAWDGRWGSNVGNPEDEDRATGEYHKQGDWVRLRWDRGRPPVVTDVAGGGVVFTEMSFDEVSLGPLTLAYRKRYGVERDSIWVTPRHDLPDAMYRAGPTDHVGAHLTPFSAGGGRGGIMSPLEYLPKLMQERGGRFRCRVSREEPDRVIFHMDGAGTNGETEYQRTIRVTFWTQPALPVIERVDWVSRTGDDVPTEYTLSLSDFVQCGGGMMARRLQSASGPYPPPANAPEGKPHDKPWLAMQWISRDLGERDPQPDDFVVSIPAGVLVRGLRSPPPQGKPVTIDLSQLSLDDLDTGDGFVAGARSQSGTRGRVSVLFGTGLLVIVVFIYYTRRLAAKRFWGR